MQLEKNSQLEREKKNSKLSFYLDYLVEWIREKVIKAGKKGVVFGLSGGIDSCVVGFLARAAFPKNHIALILPCESSKSDVDDAKLVVKKFNLSSLLIDLNFSYRDLARKMFNSSDEGNEWDLKTKAGVADSRVLALSNIKPRLRMVVLYSIAASKDYLVIGSTNQDEWYLGYFTKHGDDGADIFPLFWLLKREIKTIAKVINSPERIILKSPSAGLWKGQSDEKEMKLKYEEIDSFLMGKVVSKLAQQRIKQMHKMSKHKRKKLIVPRKFVSCF